MVHVWRSMHKALLKRGRPGTPSACPNATHTASVLCGSIALCIAALSLDACVPLKAADDRGDGASPAASCAHRQPPSRPTHVTAGGDVGDLVFAMNQVSMGTHSYDDAGRQLYESIGFDLDDTCTGEGQGPSCSEPSWATKPHKDGVEGIDNAFGQMEWGLQNPDPIIFGAGPNYMVLRVRGYSGAPNDERVEVAWYCAYGLASVEADAGPNWDGQDRWTIDPQVLAPPADGEAPSLEAPLYVDPHAYVSGGVLVARFDEAPGNYSNLAPSLLIPLHGVVLQGSLRRVDTGTWELDDGIVGARMAMSSFLEAYAWTSVGPFPEPPPNCKFPATEPAFIQLNCSYADIAYDGGSPETPCDALSVGLAFQAKQALLGEVGGPPPSLPLCDPSVHPMTQRCDAPGNY